MYSIDKDADTKTYKAVEYWEKHKFDFSEWDSMDIDEIKVILNQNIDNVFERNPFIDGLIIRLNELKFECTDSVEDRPRVLKEVKRRFKEKFKNSDGRYVGEKYKAVWEWIKENAIPGVTARENLYLLCIALEMDFDYTIKFFYKYYLTQPFNPKDRTDAVFMYCINRNRPFSVIRAMLDRVESVDLLSKNDEANDDTEIIGTTLGNIDDDEEAIKYIEKNSYKKSQQFNSVKKEIQNLISKHNKDNMSGLFFDITEKNYQSDHKQKNKNSGFPDRFTKSFPTDRTLLNLAAYQGNAETGDKDESFETLRKTLIILYFYDYFMELIASDQKSEKLVRNNVEIDMLFLEFCEALDNKLVSCNLTPLYYRHPFDFLILSCANSNDPLLAFQSLCAKMYRNDNS